MTRKLLLPIIIALCLSNFWSCQNRGSQLTKTIEEEPAITEESAHEQVREPIVIEKELTFTNYTMEDVYPYKDTTRFFNWEKITQMLELLDSVQNGPQSWAILQNRHNKNGKVEVAKDAIYNHKFKGMTDRNGIRTYQAIPLYEPGDTIVPDRYGRDGNPMKIIKEDSLWFTLAAWDFEGTWIVPRQYIYITEPVIFERVIFVDRDNQNIATLEKSGTKWLVRSMNPATTGVDRPPYAQETPKGIYVVQEKKEKMFYLVDGTDEIAGFAMYATRFCNGGYIHGLPAAYPQQTAPEYNATLGSVPRSHMCVRNATSHAQFVFDFVTVDKALVMVY